MLKVHEFHSVNRDVDTSTQGASFVHSMVLKHPHNHTHEPLDHSKLAAAPWSVVMSVICCSMLTTKLRHVKSTKSQPTFEKNQKPPTRCVTTCPGSPAAMPLPT